MAHFKLEDEMRMTKSLAHNEQRTKKNKESPEKIEPMTFRVNSRLCSCHVLVSC